MSVEQPCGCAECAYHHGDQASDPAERRVDQLRAELALRTESCERLLKQLRSAETENERRVDQLRAELAQLRAILKTCSVAIITGHAEDRARAIAALQARGGEKFLTDLDLQA